MLPHATGGMHIATPQQRLAHGSQSETSRAYLSLDNRVLLYSAVVRDVHRRTNGKITMGPRPDEDLHAIMLNCLDDRLTLKELNERAFHECVAIAMNNIASYLGYLRDINDKSNHQRNDVSAILRPANTRSYKEAAARPPY